MGSVWVADHLSLQEQVAVKFMAPAMLEDPVAVARFQQEATAAAKIKSPHVVQVFDHGTTDDGEHYIVMELLEGVSLEKRIRQTGPLGVPAMTNIISQAAKAIAKAHEKGVYHRDVKPANIFLMDSGGDIFVKVLDFGVAKISGEDMVNMTAAGKIVGTPAYMSPEQFFSGKNIDHRCDLWALAVVAYFMLAGERPFRGATLGELCVTIKRGEFIPPSATRADVPPAVDDWFRTALHPDLDQRFRSAKHMAEALGRAAGMPTMMESTPSMVASSPAIATFPGTAISSHPSTIADAPRRRSPLLWLGVAAVALGGIGGAAFMVGRSGVVDAAPAAGASEATPVGAVASASAEAEVELPSQTPVEGDVGEVETPPEHVASAEPSASAKAPPPKRGTAPSTKSTARSGKTKPEPKSGTKPESKDKPGDERSQRAGEELGI
jgi:serine/threonine-protein kinase